MVCHKHTIRLLLVASAVGACLIAGCEQKFTRQKFETVYVGMPDYAVEQKLGRPQETTPDKWAYTGRRPYYRVEIIFRDGRVVETKWGSEPATRPNDAPAK